jgi:hypothetical protein
MESSKCHLGGVIARDLSISVSNYRSAMTLDDYLREQKVRQEDLNPAAPDSAAALYLAVQAPRGRCCERASSGAGAHPGFPAGPLGALPGPLPRRRALPRGYPSAAAPS